MANTKTTKKALLASLLSFALCLTMLIGSTFAWFTDTATTGVNTIVAGNLKIDLEMAIAWDEAGNPTAWDTAEGKMLNFKKAAGAPATEAILWEPGCRYQLPELRIVNKGDLDLKYMISITGIDGDAKLNEVIEWTYGDYNYTVGSGYVTLAANTASEIITIEGHMLESAGNQYQGLTIDGISISVFATQVESESDSFTNDYDAVAPYLEDENGNILIGDVPALFYFAQQVNENGNTFLGKTVLLTNDIDLAGFNWTPIGATGAGNAQFFGTFNGQGYAIKNLNIDTTSMGRVNEAAAGLFGWIENHNSANPTVITGLTIEGATVNSGKYAGAIAGYTGAYVTIQECAVKNATLTGTRTGAVAGFQQAPVAITNCEAVNATLTGTDSVSEIVGYAANSELVTGCTATNVTMTVAGQEALDIVLANAADNATINLAAGEYTLPSNLNKNLTFAGNKDTVIKLTNDSLHANDKAITFEGVTVQLKVGQKDTYDGVKHASKVVYKDCVINGQQYIYAPECEFIDCVFNNTGDAYCVNTYGASKATFTNCTFNTAGKAILAYCEQEIHPVITVTGCKFYSDGTGADDKAAVELCKSARSADSTFELVITDSTATGFVANKTDSPLWGNKNSLDDDHIDVTIDTVVVY